MYCINSKSRRCILNQNYIKMLLVSLPCFWFSWEYQCLTSRSKSGWSFYWRVNTIKCRWQNDYLRVTWSGINRELLIGIFYGVIIKPRRWCWGKYVISTMLNARSLDTDWARYGVGLIESVTFEPFFYFILCEITC